MAVLARTVPLPLLLTYGHVRLYLQTKQGCTLYMDNNPTPIFQSTEPVLLAQGVITNTQTVHLVVLKATGELTYNLISLSGTNQTTLLANLDVRSTKYRRLILLPLGKMVHIFYAYNHQAIPDLWRIEHRFWDGKSWLSGHLGEVVHPKEPLYNISLDNQGNIHLLTMTFQGRQSIVFSNRFHGSFHIWGSPKEALKIQGEVVDMNAIMTPDNVYYLYWVSKTITGQFELCWAQLSEAHNLASTWFTAPAPIRSFNGPWKTLGVMEVNGTIWVLASGREESLLNYDGKSWRLMHTGPATHRPFQWFHKGMKNFYHSYWLEDDTTPQAPAYYREIGLTFLNSSPTPHALSPLPEYEPYQGDLSHGAEPIVNSNPIVYSQTTSQIIAPIPPQTNITGPVDFTESLTTSKPLPESQSATNDTMDVSLPDGSPEGPAEDTCESISETSQEPVPDSTKPANPTEELQPLVEMISRLEEDNRTLTYALQTLLAKFEENENSLKRMEQKFLEWKEEAKAQAEATAKEIALAVTKESLAEPSKGFELDLMEEAAQEVIKPQATITQTANSQQKGFWNRWFT